MDMGAAVDGFPGNMGRGHTDICIIRVIGSVVALLHYIGPAFHPVSQVPFRAFLAVGTVHAFSIHVYVGFHF